MNILNKILDRSITQEKFDSLLEMPRKYLGEEVLGVIPNLTMTNEGPVLSRVYMITKSYLCEIKISDGDNSHFDLVDKAMVINIRVATTVTTVSIGDETTISYKAATIRIVHGPSMESVIEFIGGERDEWVVAVLELLPASLTCHRH
jgi:hypothetical protein